MATPRKAPAPVPARPGPRPWDDAGEGRAHFELRLSARHKAMLAWLSDVQPRRSMHTIILDALEPALEAEAERLWRERGG